MAVIEAVIIVLSMYTKIPMPLLEWNARNTRLVLAFLWLPGFIAGFAQALWLAVCCFLPVTPVMYAAVAVALSVIVTGGIHMDGFTDTVDALCSHGSREKMRKIMDDPHIGSFGVMHLVIYMLLTFALFFDIGGKFTGDPDFYQREMRYLFMIITLYTDSMAITAIAAVTAEPSKTDGMLYRFTSGANREAVISLNAGIMALLTIISVFAFGLDTVSIIIPPLLAYIYVWIAIVPKFGGISGDICGWMIEMSKLTGLLLVRLI